uniref:Uncharacterized protein n=1 Tax=Chromera velia CCMP2878 TaxID=1169474 RepID=A0A0G4HGP1_9ALVE|eukprot:Cvel_27315.t1-p1 / transcript=Cvel_27315.t1 / gene=Cvel_27315 / organism=Chromera_velia_CCMP2878 / gene_product=hypothetical protein / transcript_product=hypothetical protein / location=Cvel_scaffold3387:1199-7849(-) / protein_length=505 / sequence_SO=supercontig / SO=protein_coding / is_pseudo=false
MSPSLEASSKDPMTVKQNIKQREAFVIRDGQGRRLGGSNDDDDDACQIFLCVPPLPASKAEHVCASSGEAKGPDHPTPKVERQAAVDVLSRPPSAESVPFSEQCLDTLSTTVASSGKSVPNGPTQSNVFSTEKWIVPQSFFPNELAKEQRRREALIQAKVAYSKKEAFVIRDGQGRRLGGSNDHDDDDECQIFFGVPPLRASGDPSSSDWGGDVDSSVGTPPPRSRETHAASRPSILRGRRPSQSGMVKGDDSGARMTMMTMRGRSSLAPSSSSASENKQLVHHRGVVTEHACNYSGICGECEGKSLVPRMIRLLWVDRPALYEREDENLSREVAQGRLEEYEGTADGVSLAACVLFVLRPGFQGLPLNWDEGVQFNSLPIPPETPSKLLDALKGLLKPQNVLVRVTGEGLVDCFLYDFSSSLFVSFSRFSPRRDYIFAERLPTPKETPPLLGIAPSSGKVHSVTKNKNLKGAFHHFNIMIPEVFVLMLTLPAIKVPAVCEFELQ